MSHRMERVHTRSQETELQPQHVQEMGLIREQLSSGCAAPAPPAQVWRHSPLKKGQSTALIHLEKHLVVTPPELLCS